MKLTARLGVKRCCRTSNIGKPQACRASEAFVKRFNLLSPIQRPKFFLDLIHLKEHSSNSIHIRCIPDPQYWNKAWVSKGEKGRWQQRHQYPRRIKCLMFSLAVLVHGSSQYRIHSCMVRRVLEESYLPSTFIS